MSVTSVGTFGLVSSYSISANKGADRNAETTGAVAYLNSRDTSVKQGTETTGAVAFNGTQFENGIYQNMNTRTGNPGFEAAA